MSQTRLQQTTKPIILYWFLLLICITVLSGCTSSIGLSQPTAIPTVPACPTITPGTVPTNITSGINIYHVDISIITSDNINMLISPDPSLASINLAKARYAALDRLTHQVERWTDIQSIKVDDTSEIKIMVTFLHPDLIQAVALNNSLLNNPNVLNNPAPIQQIRDEVTKALKQFEARNKLIFLITIPKIDGAPHTIYTDIHKMILKNSKNISIPPAYEEHNLDQTISPNERSVFGYFYYPLEVMDSNNCIELLSSEYNSWIVIENPAFVIDNASAESKTWTIPYTPLLETGTIYYTPEIPPVEQLSLEPILPVNEPPQTNLPIEALKNNKGYWSEFGRFVWAQLTFEMYNK